MGLEQRIVRLTKQNKRRTGKLLLAQGRRIPINTRIGKKTKRAIKSSLKLGRAKITQQLRKL